MMGHSPIGRCPIIFASLEMGATSSISELEFLFVPAARKVGKEARLGKQEQEMPSKQKLGKGQCQETQQRICSTSCKDSLYQFQMDTQNHSNSKTGCVLDWENPALALGFSVEATFEASIPLFKWHSEALINIVSG